MALLDQDAQAGGRLASFATFASHQVDEQLIEAIRAHHPSDSDLIGVLRGLVWL